MIQQQDTFLEMQRGIFQIRQKIEHYWKRLPMILQNIRGTDKYGNEWYTKTQSDGSQVWVESRNGNIFEGGVNNTPKPWNPETGLKKP